MTEREYTLEMLCCTPMELLRKRLEGNHNEVPEWLAGISQEIICEAIESYDEPSYAKKRFEMLGYI